MVIHAPTVLLNYKGEQIYVADPETGDYIIDCFYIQPKKPTAAQPSHLEISYIAFAETLEDVETLFAEDAKNDDAINNVIVAKQSKVTLAYALNPTTNEKEVVNVVNGKIQTVG